MQIGRLEARAKPRNFTRFYVVVVEANVKWTLTKCPLDWMEFVTLLCLSCVWGGNFGVDSITTDKRMFF